MKASKKVQFALAAYLRERRLNRIIAKLSIVRSKVQAHQDTFDQIA
ncbi:hypothetical protein [Xanthomonas oryzae]|nr:hypothetical protein [Xanthomonas oryzae]